MLDKLADSLVKLLPVLTAVVGAIWALYAYLDHAKQDRAARLVEIQRPFLEKQLALYFETTQVTGDLVSLDGWHDQKWLDRTHRFWALYWSELAMVESRDVEGAMVEFGRALTETENARTGTDQANFRAHQNSLNGLALDVAHAIRASIESSWALQQGTVAAPRAP
jgi:hypothetical protein